MEFSEKKNALFYSSLLVSMFILFMIFGEKEDRILYFIVIIMTISMDLLMLIVCSKWLRKIYIRLSCPNLWKKYFKETEYTKDNINEYSTGIGMSAKRAVQSTKDFLLTTTFDNILQQENYLIRDNKRETEIKETKAKLMELVNAKKDGHWLSRVTEYLDYLYKRCNLYDGGIDEYISIDEYKFELDILNKETLKYADKYGFLSAIRIKDNHTNFTHDDITHDDIINHNVEFEEDAIYVKEKVWDGVQYTLKRQRVFVYKRDYNLNQDIPRFHICRCSTMDEFIRAGALTTSYRKSVNKIVLVKNKDNYMQECQISHLPLCKNCYKKMKEQYSWLCSEMDNEDFIKNVIDKTPWGPDVN